MSGCRYHVNAPVVGCESCEALRQPTANVTPNMTAQERAAYDEFKAASLDLKAKKAAYDEAAVRVRDAINEMANAAAGTK